MPSWFDRSIGGACSIKALISIRRMKPCERQGRVSEKMMLARRRGLLLIALFIVAIPCVQATAAPGSASTSPLNQPLSALHHTSFTARDGAPAGVTSFAQTPDGFLWIGSHYGLYLFDGVSFRSQADTPLQSSHIMGLWADKNGDLWIGFSVGGVSLLHDGHVTNYLGNGLPAGTSFSFARTPDGTLWVATTLGLGRFINGAWQTVGADWGLAGIHPQDMRVGSDGTLWLLGSANTYRLKPHSHRFDELDVDAYSVQGMGLPTSVPIVGTNLVSWTEVDSSGAVWQDSKEGLTRYRWVDSSKGAPPTTEVLSADDKLSGNFVYTMFEDKDGNFWLGTNGGLDRFRRHRLNVVPFPKAIFQPAIAAGDHGDIWVGDTKDTGYHVSDTVESVPAIPPLTSMMTRTFDGSIWLSASPGLMLLKEGQLTSVRLPSDIKELGFSGQAFTKEGDGALWLSVVRQGLRRYKDGVWTINGGLSQLPVDQNPFSLITAPDGSVWMGYPRNRLYAVNGDRVQHYDAQSGISVGAVQVISVRGATVWIGGERGVQLLNGKSFVALKGERGEDFTNISGIIQTDNGDLWLNGAFGLYRVKASELQQLRQQPSYNVAFDHFSSSDGLDGPAVQFRPTPTLIQGTDGRLWATTENGVVWVDPKNISSSANVLLPVIQTIDAGDVLHSAQERPKLAAGSTNVHIVYTAPALGEPERVLFRYRLLGFEKEWQQAGTRREAYYTNLGPGEYTFQLQSQMEGGGWSPQIAEATFFMLPHFYQTWWFRALILLCVAIILAMLHLLRLRRVEARLQIRRHERERVARDLHDTLLQSVQGLIFQVHAASDHDGDPVERHRILSDAVTAAQNALKEGRDKVMELRDEGSGSFELAELIREMLLHPPAVFDGKSKVVVTGNPTPLCEAAKEEIYAVAREMIINAWNHAMANVIEVSIHYNWRSLVVRVSDDGCGLPESVCQGAVPSGRWGILGMRERARKLGGSLQFKKGVNGHGTEAELHVRARRAYVKRWARF